MNNKKKMLLSVAGTVFGLLLLIASGIITEKELIPEKSAIALMIVSTILVLISVIYSTKVDYETGVYECPECGRIFKPTLKAYIMGEHTLRKRRLRCPECNAKSWCLRKTSTSD